MSEEAFTIWFTGLTCSGKSTLARMVRDRLVDCGASVELLDSGAIRRELNRDLGFTPEEIAHNLKRLAYECRLLNRNGVVAVVAAVSPFRGHRAAVRTQIDRFVEVYCEAPLEVLEQRDDLNLIARARRGEITDVAGVDAPYEPPEHPEVHLRTDQLTPEQATDRIVESLAALGYLAEAHPHGYTPQEKQIIESRLKNLGYS